MNDREIYLGFDPGGKDRFGWCVLGVEGEIVRVIDSGVGSSAVEVLREVRNVLKVARKHLQSLQPMAVGIDAPLYWVTEGDRHADKQVREAVKNSPEGKTSTVLAINSLRGACLVQGAIIARLVRKEWPECLLAEAHPKALLAVKQEIFQRISDDGFVPRHPGDHERDAVLAAYSAIWTNKKKAGWVPIRSDDNNAVEITDAPFPQYWFPTNSA